MENYSQAWTFAAFNTFFKNSLMITILTIIGHLFSCSCVAFGFAFYDFKFKRILFIILLSTMMLPFPVVMIPQFKIFASLGWVDTMLPLVVPAYFGNAVFIFLLVQFFRSLPRDLFEAARIDGSSEPGLLVRIAIPLMKPALITVGVFTFMAAWNDFMGPLIYLNSEEKFTLAIGLTYFEGLYGAETHLMMAASVIILAPCVVIFFIAQKYFIEGIITTGIKG